MATTAAQTERSITRLRENIARVYVGSSKTVDRLIIVLLARGHVLIEDVPGVGKTVLAHAIARSLDLAFSRIQLTPDLLPSDILGVSVFNRDAGTFQFHKGPIFAGVVLADEINRTPPRTQSALLEAMGEGAVTVDGVRHALGRPFMVIATQNPAQFEGTYPLPENQLDRFLMRLRLGYPSPEDEARVLQDRPGEHTLPDLPAVLSAQEIVSLQESAEACRMDRSLVDYIVALANATRRSEELLLGLSTRGALALSQAARATAVLAGRDYVIPEDITENIVPVCAHRVIGREMGSSLEADSAEETLARILASVPSPA